MRQLLVVAGERLLQTVQSEQRLVTNRGRQLAGEQRSESAGQHHRGRGIKRLLHADPVDQAVDQGRKTVDRLQAIL